MRTSRATLALVGALLVAAALAVFAILERTPPKSPVELVPTAWSAARKAPMHEVHVGEKKIACAECHTATGTENELPGPASCAKCHTGETQHDHHGAEPMCLGCHTFAGGKHSAECADCHARGAQRGATHLEHHTDNVACNRCHTIHAAEQTKNGDCTTCHEAIGAAHGRSTIPPRVERSTHDGSLDTSAHAADVCSACHVPHAGKEAASGKCAECHAQHGDPRAPAIAPRGHRVAGHEACTTCHEPHRARKQDVRACESCHEDRRAVTSVEGHAACTGCHSGHAPAEAASSCKTCHAAVETIAAERVTAHADCASCHDPHRPDRSPRDACRGCHENVGPSHPSTRGECVGCHAPHGGKGAIDVHLANRTACSFCHTNAPNDRAFHVGGSTTCTQCHKAHDFRIDGSSATLCRQCHPAEGKATRRAHENCQGCHGATHAPVAKPACTSCHTEKGHALHGNVPGGCTNCHAAHGPDAKKPACTSCHSRPSLPGLHASGAHAPCTTCHSTHSPPHADRATCTGSCHADRREHQPGAKSCNGCHIFRR